MNLRECYMKLDGNYDEVVQRLQNEYIVEKFMFKFLKDKSFNFLKISIQNENYEDAHRYVHTIKGICQNLSFSKLYESSHQMTNEFKNNNYKKALDLMPQLSKDYYQIIDAINEYQMFKEKQQEWVALKQIII